MTSTPPTRSSGSSTASCHAPSCPGSIPYLEFKGRLELARGRLHHALNSFLALRDALPPEWTSSSFVAWRPGAALAHRRLGNTRAAAELAEQEVQIAKAFGAPHERGIALRTRGLVQGGEAGIADVEHALELLEAAGTRLEHGWALHALGSLLRRQQHHVAAREPLRAAVDYAARSGAELLRQRAIDELHAVGAKPRRDLRSGVEALTARELRVAQLAAQGHSNADIAQLLFVTYKTVDTHLGHVYQKLDVTRPGLASAPVLDLSVYDQLLSREVAHAYRQTELRLMLRSLPMPAIAAQFEDLALKSGQGQPDARGGPV